MKTYLLLIIALTAPALGLCQNSTRATVKTETFPVPVVILDSMIFEIRKGRSCDSLQQEQKKLIQQQSELLVTNATAIRLQGEQIDSYKLINASWATQYDLVVSGLKVQIKGLKRIIYKLVGGVVVLIVVIIVVLL